MSGDTAPPPSGAGSACALSLRPRWGPAVSHPQAQRPPAVPPALRGGTARKRKGLCRMRAPGPGCPRGSVIQGFGGRICNKDMQSDAIYNRENWKQPKSPPPRPGAWQLRGGGDGDAST